jgi:hypothetical protein
MTNTAAAPYPGGMSGAIAQSTALRSADRAPFRRAPERDEVLRNEPDWARARAPGFAAACVAFRSRAAGLAHQGPTAAVVPSASSLTGQSLRTRTLTLTAATNPNGESAASTARTSHAAHRGRRRVLGHGLDHRRQDVRGGHRGTWPPARLRAAPSERAVVPQLPSVSTVEIWQWVNPTTTSHPMHIHAADQMV